MTHWKNISHMQERYLRKDILEKIITSHCITGHSNIHKCAKNVVTALISPTCSTVLTSNSIILYIHTHAYTSTSFNALR